MSHITADSSVPERLPAESMPVGAAIDCGTYEVSAAEIVDFASTWDPQYFHVDPQAAAHSQFGGLIASGLHIAAIFQRLAAASLFTRYDVIAGKEIRHVRFLLPVRAGDILTASAVVRSVEPDGPGRHHSVVVGALHNQHGAAVLDLEIHTLVRSRAARVDAPAPGHRSNPPTAP